MSYASKSHSFQLIFKIIYFILTSTDYQGFYSAPVIENESLILSSVNVWNSKHLHSASQEQTGKLPGCKFDTIFQVLQRCTLIHDLIGHKKWLESCGKREKSCESMRRNLNELEVSCLRVECLLQPLFLISSMLCEE